MNNNFSIDGVRVVVTAGASGIGYAVASAFDRQGAKIHICDVSDEALDECQSKHPHWGQTKCDVSDETQVQKLFNEANAFLGGVDVLVNNAGIAGPTGGVDQIDTEHWRKTIDINLNGQFYCAKYATPLLRKSDNASIICISSIAGRLAYANRTPYAATKWAIRGLAESLAQELGVDGIRVNSILPGIVEGPRIEAVIRARAENENVSFEDMNQKYKDMASLRRMVTAEDVANQILFLCSPLGKNISGQSISIDGHVRAL
ncbi:MAG: 3-oxoacyl-[acyl-carrier-protein] reductase [Alphaproteobacteria bacterium]|nr:3-oxoacyl-[acyl-carrier-protein] reductase [Alphaproteobacteria bacterium]